MSEHVLTIEVNPKSLSESPDDPDYSWAIDCIHPERCIGWQECTGDHEGFDPDDEGSPAYEHEEDVEIHGELHDWRSGHGWTTKYEGCVDATCDAELPDDLYPVTRSGSWIVKDVWDDTECVLEVIREAIH